MLWYRQLYDILILEKSNHVDEISLTALILSTAKHNFGVSNNGEKILRLKAIQKMCENIIKLDWSISFILVSTWIAIYHNETTFLYFHINCWVTPLPKRDTLKT